MTRSETVIILLFLYSYIDISKQYDYVAVKDELFDPPLQTPLYGRAAEIELAPYTAAIYNLGYYQCVGSYFKPDWIISSGFCLHEVKAKDSFVTMGSKELNDIVQQSNVSDVVVHPYFEKAELKNDIGLLRLLKPFTIGPKVKMIDLNEVGLKYPIECTVSGWGLPAYKNYVQVENINRINLRQGKVTLLQHDQCGSILRKQHHIRFDDKYVCAKQEDGCNPGAALVCGNKQAGIVSAHVGHCTFQQPSFFVNVEKYKTWITIHVNRRSRSSSSIRVLYNFCVISIGILITFKLL